MNNNVFQEGKLPFYDYKMYVYSIPSLGINHW